MNFKEEEADDGGSWANLNKNEQNNKEGNRGLMDMKLRAKRDEDKRGESLTQGRGLAAAAPSGGC